MEWKERYELTMIPLKVLDEHPANRGIFRPGTEDEINDLAESVTEIGLIHPVRVRPKPDGRYEIISGHLRVRALRLAGEEEVLCLVDRDLDDVTAERQVIHANVKGRIPGPMDFARAFARDMELMGLARERRGRPSKSDKENSDHFDPNFLGSQDWTSAILAREYGVSPAKVKRYLRLNKLIPELQALVQSGGLDVTKAAEIALLSEDTQKALLEKLKEELNEFTVAEVRELRRKLQELEKEKASVERESSLLKERLSEAEKRIEELESLNGGDRENGELKEVLELAESYRVQLQQLQERLRELQENPVERIVYRTDPALEAELEAAKKHAAELLKQKEWFENRYHEVTGEKTRAETKVRALEEEVEVLQRHLDHARRELEKEKSRPRPRFDQRRENFRGLAEKARKLAFDLADTLREIEEAYSSELLASARTRGGPDLEDIAGAVVDVGIYRTLEIALQTAAGRLNRIFDLLKAGKPNLQLIKGKEQN